MQLIDLNNMIFSGLFAALGKHTNTKLELPLIRHMVLNNIRAINVKNRNKYGEIVLCADSPNCWRKDVFPYYKASRKQNRDKSDLDWNTLFEIINQIRAELKTAFPYKYIQVENTEADDIIAVISSSTDNDPVLIVSADKDYQQLQVNDNIDQYDPNNKRMIKVDDPDQYLFNHIIKGDVGDGIPNIASPDNCFVIGERQKKITKRLLGSLTNIDNNKNHIYYRNYCRNKILIDFKQIPNPIQQKITTSFKQQQINSRDKIFKYFVDNKLTNLMEHINDF